VVRFSFFEHVHVEWWIEIPKKRTGTQNVQNAERTSVTLHQQQLVQESGSCSVRCVH
jgi:hypothetical protein